MPSESVSERPSFSQANRSNGALVLNDGLTCLVPPLAMLPLLALAPLLVALTNRPSPTNCQRPDGTSAPCGPGNDLCHSPGYGSDGPQFHVRDRSCAMNDPAAVVYDPVVSARPDRFGFPSFLTDGQHRPSWGCSTQCTTTTGRITSLRQVGFPLHFSSKCTKKGAISAFFYRKSLKKRGKPSRGSVRPRPRRQPRSHPLGPPPGQPVERPPI